jgi:uncharacterized membrane protein
MRGFARKILDTRWLAALFLICALPSGVGMALFTPMGEIPDEPSHISRADGLLYGQILGRKDPHSLFFGVTNRVVLAQAGLSELRPSFPDLPLPEAAKEQARAIQWTPATAIRPSNMVQYFPALYLPGALGILFGQALDASPLHTLFIGRLAMLASFLVFGFTALSLARFGRPLFFTILTMPMTLCLAASFNEDGQMIAATVLGVALLTRASSARSVAWLAALALLTLVMCSKPPYALLLFTAALPLAAPGLWRRFGAICLFGLAPALWMFIMVRYIYTPWVRAAYHPGPLWPGSPNIWLTSTSNLDNLKVLLAHPAQIFLLPLNWAETAWPYTWRGVFGTFGWGPVHMAAWQYTGWIIALAAAALACLGGKRPLPWRVLDAGFVLALIFVSVLAMALSMYLTWTNVGQASIDGINGRYFLMFPPFLVLALPGLGAVFRRAATLEAALTLPAVAMAASGIYLLPELLLQCYKMGWP